jgi:hypothetical protein
MDGYVIRSIQCSYRFYEVHVLGIEIIHGQFVVVYFDDIIFKKITKLEHNCISEYQFYT